MRNIATCYSEQAVKVSDSYCSAYPNRSYISPKSKPQTPPSPKPTPTHNAVACTYKAKVSSHKHLHVTITWSSKLIRQGFGIRFVDKLSPPPPDGSANSFPAYRIGAEKGTERFGSCSSEIEVYWDLSTAKFDGFSPVPVGSFYVVLLIDSQLSLLLGDMGEDPFVKKLVTGLPTTKSAQVSQCEHLSGVSQFSTRARFGDSGPVHEVVIRCGTEDEGRGGGEVGPDPVLSVMIDKKRMVRVRRLQWNFRGNEVVFVDGSLVDVMWDIRRLIFQDHHHNHGRFSSSGSLSSSLASSSSLLSLSPWGFDGVFMFRTRSGLDSRLWLEEQKLAEKNNDKVEFSFLICACKNPS